VGFILLFIITSSNYWPKILSSVILSQFIYLSFGKPISAEVDIHPATFILWFLITRLNISIPPIECPYRNTGRFLLQCCNMTSISECIYSIVEDPLGPPLYLKILNKNIYPKPLKSIKKTTNPFLAKWSAIFDLIINLYIIHVKIYLNAHQNHELYKSVLFFNC